MPEYIKPLAICFLLSAFAQSPAVAAPCTVPNPITNGQVADASKVMENFDAIARCVDQAVKTTGSPKTGSVAVFSDAKAVSSGNLTGDVTTTGGTATTLSKTGVTAGAYSNANIIVDAKGRITAASSGSAGGGGGGTASSRGDIVMALGAAWAKEMVVKGARITAGVARSAKADLGAYVGMRMIANTKSDFSNRVIPSPSESDSLRGDSQMPLVLIHMWTPPMARAFCRDRFDRLLSYVRPVCAA